VGKNTVQGIVLESGKVICKVPQPKYFIPVPNSDEWLRIADESNETC